MNRAARTDALMVGALFAGSVLYLVSLPHNLGFADESYFLYEAKRIRDGEMLYRDVFQWVTPIAPHVMAGLYWLFGTTMSTARVSTAVVHGLTVILIYASARMLRVAAPLAAVAGLAHVAVAQPSWPFASWHWFSTVVTAAILLVLMRGHWAQSAWRTFALGALCGVLVGIQQQRGVIPTAGVGLIVVGNAIIDARTRRAWGMAVMSRAAVFAAGVALIVAPLLLVFAAGAGFEPMYQALVRFPMENYRNSFRTTWGSLSPLSRAYAADTFPRVLRLLPLALALPLLRAGVDVGRLRDGEEARRLGSLIVFAAASVGSIWYYPDFIHIAFVAGPLLVSAALSVQWLIEALPLPAVGTRALAWIIAGVVAATLAQHLGRLARAKWDRYPYALETAFGRIDFASRWEPLLADAVRSRLERSASTELFCYPSLAAPYLTTGGKNPTPFQYFYAPVFPPRDAARVVATLEQRRVPYVLASAFGLGKDDPIAQLIERDYELVWIPELADAWPSPSLLLFQRKSDHD